MGKVVIPFLPKKDINFDLFKDLMSESIESNQLTNYGPLVKKLEKKAHKMLKLEKDYSVIATCNGSGALHAIAYAFERKAREPLSRAVQNFTFPSSAQGSLSGSHKVDLTLDYQINSQDPLMLQFSKMLLITNLFGHVQNLDKIFDDLIDNEKIVIFDNAATPYTFVGGINSCCLADASMISLHHTKPIGFGEGGLAIVKTSMEKDVREIINFGNVGGEFNERGSNWKMSELAAAGILQYWDSFDIDDLAKKYRENYFNLVYQLNVQYQGDVWPTHCDEDSFFPSNLPYIFKEVTDTDMTNKVEIKKYYKPLTDLPNSTWVYDRVINFPLHETVEL